MTSIAVLAGFAILFLVLAFRSKRRSGDFRYHQGEPMDELLRLCGGDADQAERLIAFEICQNPAISQAEAVKHAIHRYRRDNR